MRCCTQSQESSRSASSRSSTPALVSTCLRRCGACGELVRPVLANAPRLGFHRRAPDVFNAQLPIRTVRRRSTLLPPKATCTACGPLSEPELMWAHRTRRALYSLRWSPAKRGLPSDASLPPPQWGDTPLHVAVSDKWETCVVALVEAGASIHSVNSVSEPPLDDDRACLSPSSTIVPSPGLTLLGPTPEPLSSPCGAARRYATELRRRPRSSQCAASVQSTPGACVE